MARTNAAFGPGIGQIFLDDMKCNGLEYRLLDCVHAAIEVNNCDHRKDAGVVCVAGINIEQHTFIKVSPWMCPLRVR